MNKTTICVINGKGGIGKDTLIGLLNQEKDVLVYNISSIDPIRELLTSITIGRDKNLAQRKLLATVKEAVDAYYKNEYDISYTQNYLQEEVKFALDDAKEYDKEYDYENVFIFVHIREPENIQEFLHLTNKELCNRKDEEIKIVTLLVESNRAKNSYGNSSDENVNNYPYDYIFISNEDKETDGKRFVQLMKYCYSNEMPMEKKQKNDITKD